MPVTEYTWDPVTDSILEETDGAGNVLASYTNEPSAYGPLISQHRDDESRYFHFDALGSTRELTDGDENVTDAFAYDAWGNTVTRVGGIPVSFLWTGQWGYQMSEKLSLCDIRRRLFATARGRWICPDPLEFLDSNNRYTFTRNSPIYNTDPSGLVTVIRGSGGGRLVC